ncbi:chaperone protein DnaJ [Nitzschia inconspicua]|uniref:Chaperone protein DnaJ n=1 Tax=Nitzschia inconspicua TaxID=303405 RepID=A0A9K3Q0V4_9STRA|nr:chaperone protein DnaJ [Nitzschia inconspicua]
MECGDDPYEILEISPESSTAEIRKKYRQLALLHHPDRQSNDEDRERCHNIFARLSAAYEILSDEENRARYDQQRKRRKDDTGPQKGPPKGSAAKPSSEGRPVRSPPSTSKKQTTKTSSFSSFPSKATPSRPTPSPGQTKSKDPPSSSPFNPKVTPSRPPKSPSDTKTSNRSSFSSFSSRTSPRRPSPVPSTKISNKASSFSSCSPRMSVQASTKAGPNGVKPSSHSPKQGAAVNIAKKKTGVVPSPPFKTKDWKESDVKINRDVEGSKSTKETKNSNKKAPSKMKQRQTHLRGYKFADPYEVFREVFRDEFGEEFVPGSRPKASSVLSPKPNSPANGQQGKKSQEIGTPKKLPDDRAVMGKTATKQILHENGMVETITTTTITRANGEIERITRSSMEKLSKAEHEALFQTNCTTPTHKTPKKQVPSPPPRQTRVVR